MARICGALAVFQLGYAATAGDAHPVFWVVWGVTALVTAALLTALESRGRDSYLWFLAILFGPYFILTFLLDGAIQEAVGAGIFGGALAGVAAAWLALRRRAPAAVPPSSTFPT